MNETTITKKEVRKDARGIGLALLIYEGVFLGILNLLAKFGHYLFPNMTQSQYFEKLCDSGMPYLIIIAIGIAFFTIFFHKRGTYKELFKSERKMTFRGAGKIVALYVFALLAGFLATTLFENVLNLHGLTGHIQDPVIHGGTKTLSMTMYTCLLAPVAEELIFRGFLLCPLQKYGKATAVVITSVLFGLMHCNADQLVSATISGLLLGYIATEYSMVWSIVLHIFHNNMVDVMAMVIQGSMLVQFLVSLAIIALFVVSIVVVIRKRKAIVAWFKNNRCEETQAKWLVTSAALLAPVAVYLHQIINSVSRI